MSVFDRRASDSRRRILTAIVIQSIALASAVQAAAPPGYVIVDPSSSGRGKAANAAAVSAAAPTAMVNNPGGSTASNAISGSFLSSLDTAYQICPQDVVEIRVFGQTTMDTVTRVDARGALNFPPVGQVLAVDLTERQLETLLEDRLRHRFLQDPHVSAFVREMHPREVAIIGEVKAPGRYPYLFGCRSIMELIAKSGGMTDKAGGAAYIIRFDDPQWMSSGDLPSSATLTAAQPEGRVKRIAVDLNDLLINGKIGMNAPLKPGDIVTIPDAGFVHVTGKGLKKPGVYPLRRTANTVEQFIDEAGGRRFEAKRTIKVVYGATSGQQGKIERINYHKLLKRKVKGVILKPGDQVIVERSTPKYVLASIGRTISDMVHISAYWSIPVTTTKSSSSSN